MIGHGMARDDCWVDTQPPSVIPLQDKQYSHRLPGKKTEIDTSMWMVPPSRWRDDGRFFFASFLLSCVG